MRDPYITYNDLIRRRAPADLPEPFGKYPVVPLPARERMRAFSHLRVKERIKAFHYAAAMIAAEWGRKSGI